MDIEGVMDLEDCYIVLWRYPYANGDEPPTEANPGGNLPVDGIPTVSNMDKNSYPFFINLVIDEARVYSNILG